MTEMREFNDVAYLQAGIARKYMNRHNLTPKQFVELDERFHILHLIEVGYEPFHLTGDEGVLDYLDMVVEEQREAKKRKDAERAGALTGPR